MSHEAAISRGKSSLLTAVGVFVFFWIFFLATAFIPVVNVWVQTAVFFGSPFTWLLMYFKGAVTEGIHGTLLSIALYAPYPLLGAVVGYAWPLRTGTTGRVIRQIATRSIVVLAIAVVGLFFIYLAVAQAPSL